MKIPANLDSERIVLGAIVEAPEILNAVLAEGLSSAEFSVSDHQTICEAVLAMCDKGVPVDPVSLLEFCPKINPAVLADLIIGVILLEAHVLHHVRVLRRKSKLRRLLHLCDWFFQEVIAADADPDNITTQLTLEISALSGDE